MLSPFMRPHLPATTLAHRVGRWFESHAPALRRRLLREANAQPTYRARQRRRAELRVGTLADYAWYGSQLEWERAKALAAAGQQDLI
jgi:hypothetical protein